MSRGRVWQGLLDWWSPAPAAMEPSRSREVARIGTGEVGSRGQWRGLASANGSTPHEGWRRQAFDPVGSSVPASDSTGTDEDLLDFMAADHEPVDADLEFKRRLREELWALVQENEMTRQ